MTSNDTKIRKRIFIPVLLMVLVIMVITTAIVYRLQHLHIDKEGRERMAQIEQVLPHFLEEETRIIEATLASVTKSASLQQAWLSQDRQALLTQASPYFEKMRSQFSISHFYFIGLDQSCFLRVHKPARYGDIIQRHTMITAAQTGKPASGLELGPLGTVTLRHVLPWRQGEEVIGYLELGIDLPTIIAKVEKALDLRLFVGIDKVHLDRPSWEQGMAMLGYPTDWDRFGHVLIISKDIVDIPEGLLAYINLPHEQHSNKLITSRGAAQQFCAGVIELLDVSGQAMGGIFVVHNISAELSLLRRTMMSILLITGGIIVVCSSAFFLFMGRIERRLTLAHDRLQEESDSHQQTASELQAYKENLEAMVQAQTEALHGVNSKLQEEVVVREGAEKEARQAYHDMNQIFEASSSGMQVVDRDFKVVRYNQAFARLADISRDEGVGRKCFENISCPRANTPACCFKQILAGEEHVEIEMEIKRLDGKTIWVLHTTAPYYDANGKLLGTVQNYDDITARKRAEIAAQQASEAWERTFDAMGDIVTIHDAEMRIIRANKATREILGVAPEELIGKYCYDVFRGEPSPCAGCPEAKARHDYSLHTAEIHHPNLNKTFLVSASPIFSDNGDFEGVIHVAKDISAQKNLEAQFFQAQKMEAIGRLSGGVAHDFNNLLTTIIGYSELALMNSSPDAPFKEEFEAIHQAGLRAAGLTRQLLAFSRKQVLKLQEVDLNDIVENAAKMLGRLIGEDVQLELHLHKPLGKIKADSGQLDQVLMNLAINAKDAMPDGGSLLIETAVVNLDEEYAKSHKDVESGHHAVLTVTDSGMGMSHEVQKKIFEPFFTTKELGKGTGLGLATIYGIVKQHKGHIFVYSEPGNGTTFKVYLPIVPGGEPPIDQAEEIEIQGGTETILVAEDEPAILNLVARVLPPLGYRVLGAASGEEALEISKQTPERIDLLLTDVIMPGINGRQLADTLAKTRPGTKVLYMSGYTDEVIAHKGVLEPGINFINKPLLPMDLAKKIREILDS